MRIADIQIRQNSLTALQYGKRSKFDFRLSSFNKERAIERRGMGSDLMGQNKLKEKILVTSIQLFLVWFMVYLILQGDDGVFAKTSENINSTWIKFTILNIPLQLLLTALASIGLSKGSATRTNFGLLCAALNAILIASHIGLSILTG